jgi:hypothetical protein
VAALDVGTRFPLSLPPLLSGGAAWNESSARHENFLIVTPSRGLHEQAGTVIGRAETAILWAAVTAARVMETWSFDNNFLRFSCVIATTIMQSARLVGGSGQGRRYGGAGYGGGRPTGRRARCSPNADTTPNRV